MPIAFIRDMDSSSLARANGIFIMSDLRRSRHHEYDSTKRLLRNYCSVVTAPCRTTRTVFVTAPSHTNFAIASKTLQRERHQHDCILACLHLPPRQRAAAGFDATRGHLDSTAHRG